jgi:hypothetical protein
VSTETTPEEIALVDLTAALEALARARQLGIEADHFKKAEAMASSVPYEVYSDPIGPQVVLAAQTVYVRAAKRVAAEYSALRKAAFDSEAPPVGGDAVVSPADGTP